MSNQVQLEVARIRLVNGYELVAFAQPGQPEAAYRIIAPTDPKISIWVTAADALAIAAMMQTRHGHGS